MSDYRGNEIGYNEIQKTVKKSQDRDFNIMVNAEVISKDGTSITIKKIGGTANISGVVHFATFTYASITVGDTIVFINANNSIQGESYFGLINLGQ